MADSTGPWHLLRKPRRTVYDDGRLRISRTGRRPLLTIAGVINEHTRTGLVTALSRLTAGQPEVHISLRDVIQCELAGLRAIILLTGSGSEASVAARVVVLHEVPEHLTTILRILGWDCAPGLVLAGPGRPRKPTPPPGQAPMAGSRPGSRALSFARPIAISRSVTAGPRSAVERGSL